MSDAKPPVTARLWDRRHDERPAAESEGKAAVRRQLQARVTALYRQIGPQAAASLVSALLLVSVLRESGASPLVLAGAGGRLVVFLVAWAGFAVAQRHAFVHLALHQWDALYLTIVTLAAVAEGGFFAYLLAVTAAEQHVALLAALALSAGTALLMAPASFRAVAMFVVPLVGIPAVFASFFSAVATVWFATLLWLFLALLLGVSWRLAQQGAALAAANARTGAASDGDLSSVLHCVKLGIAVFDRDLRLAAWNAHYARLYAEMPGVLVAGAPLAQVLKAACRLFNYAPEREAQVLAAYGDEFALTNIAAPPARGDIKLQGALPDGRIIELSGERTGDGGWVFILNDLSDQRKVAAEALLHIARHDAVTGLPNRPTLRRGLERAVAAAGRRPELVAVIMIRLDRVRSAEDAYGSYTGDEVLIDAARFLLDVAHKSDLVGRLGGDDFVIVSTAMATVAEVEQKARAVAAGLSEALVVDGRGLPVGVAIGITVFPYDRGGADQLLRNAGAALERARLLGPCAVVMFDQDMQREMQARTALEADIRANIDSHHFMFEYQPQIDLKTKQLVGVEALLRWRHPVRGWVTPDQFIPVAELSRLIIPLTERMLPEVCMQAKAWDARGLPPFKIAVNLSPVHIRSGGFDGFFERTLAAYDLKAERFEFEITESVMMTDSAEAVETLKRLEALGVSLAVDDFGTGYASISYLRRFPVSKLKIDRSFINDLTKDPGARAIVEAVTRLGHSFGLRVIAEGVETEEQRQLLQAIGCDMAQGYLFSYPLTGDDLSRWVEERFMHSFVAPSWVVTASRSVH